MDVRRDLLPGEVVECSGNMTCGMAAASYLSCWAHVSQDYHCRYYNFSAQRMAWLNMFTKLTQTLLCSAQLTEITILKSDAPLGLFVHVPTGARFLAVACGLPPEDCHSMASAGDHFPATPVGRRSSQTFRYITSFRPKSMIAPSLLGALTEMRTG